MVNCDRSLHSVDCFLIAYVSDTASVCATFSALCSSLPSLCGFYLYVNSAADWLSCYNETTTTCPGLLDVLVNMSDSECHSTELGITCSRTTKKLYWLNPHIIIRRRRKFLTRTLSGINHETETRQSIHIVSRMKLLAPL